jgi:hypothetical protein
VTPGLTTALLTGAFGLGGVLGGVLMTSHFAQRADQRRIASEDERRWLTDRRHVYAICLGILISMLREIDGTICFLSFDGTEPIPEKDESEIKERLLEYYMRWDDELQASLGEVQLLAEPEVAELADRTAWALMELGGFVESRQPFDSFTPYLNQTRTLIDITRNAMRKELGLTDPVKTFPMPEHWPWLQDEPESVEKPPTQGTLSVSSDT